MASAEDAASEAFQQALARLDSLRDPERFGAWLRTVVVRRARIERKRRRAAQAESSDGPDPGEGPESALERLETAALVRLAARELPGAAREAVALVYFEGYSPEDAARFLSVPPGTLRRRLHEGRARLRAAIHGSKARSAMREERIRRIEELIERGAIYQAMRESMALRPPERRLVERISGGGAPPELARELAARLLRPSERASDPNHPVGSAAAAIRRALLEFPELAPGSGASLRATRAVLRVGGRTGTMYETVRESPDEASFRAAVSEMRLGDALDLTWSVGDPGGLRSVQDLLERLVTAVLPVARARFSAYDEPRYRSALQVALEGAPARAAIGGVRNTPEGTAHLRLFLETWAAARSGAVVELDRAPL
jgi:RNA polymerase sigma factor (sigma-70 family)